MVSTIRGHQNSVMMTKERVKELMNTIHEGAVTDSGEGALMPRPIRATVIHVFEGKGFIYDIENYIKNNPDVKFITVNVIGEFRGNRTKKLKKYSHGLGKAADKYGIDISVRYIIVE